MINQSKFTGKDAMGDGALGFRNGGARIFVPGGTIEFNPTGSSSSPVITIAAIDPGRRQCAGRRGSSAHLGKTFQLDYQATVADLLNANGLPVVPPGMTTSFQLTTVGSFTEIVTSLNSSGTLATFAAAPTQSSNSFFEMYYNPAVVANSLAGTGFNQGTLILSGKPSITGASIGIYSLSTTSTGAPRHHGVRPVCFQSLPRHQHRCRLGLSNAHRGRGLLRSRIFQDAD